MSFFESNKFSADDYQPSSFEALPPGDYKAIVTDLAEKVTKAGDGRYLAASFLIVEGAHSDRVVWNNYNVDNPNSTAVEIGRRELADLCRAVGVPAPRSESELLNIPVMIKVGLDKKDPSRNVIKGCKPAAPSGVQPKQAARISDEDVPTAAERAAPAAPAKPAAGSPPPWKRKQ